MKYIFTTYLTIIFLILLHPKESIGQDVLNNFENFQVQGSITTFAEDEDNGILYVGGNFTWIGPMKRNGAAVDNTGQVVANYPEINGAIEVAIPDGAGGFFIGGEFTEVGGLARTNLVQIDAAGKVTSWDPSPNNKVFTLALDNGVVYAGGFFSSIGGASRASLGAVDATTGVATSWNPSPNSPVYDLEVSGSNIFAIGAFTAIDGQFRDRIACIEIATGNVTSWDAGAIPHSLRCISISNGIVYLGGTFGSINGTARANLAALSEATAALTSWNPGTNITVYDILADGTNIYVGGAFATIDGVSRGKLASFDQSTGIITSWNPISNSNVYDLEKNGTTLYVGGLFSTIAGEIRRGAAAFNTSTGNLISSFEVGGTSKTVYTVSASGSQIFVGGSFTGIGGTYRPNLAAIDVATGELISWDPDVDGQVAELVLSGTNLYVGGYFSNIGGAARQGVAILNETTALATTWDANLSSNGSVLSIIPGKSSVFIGGAFTSVNGTARSNIAEVNLSNGTATSWNPNANSSVRDMEFSEGTKLYVGGSFTSIGGESRNRIAEINLSDGLATSWNPDASSTIYDIEVDSDDIPYVGGQFTTIGGQSRSNLAALDPATGSATAWNPTANNTVLDLNIVDGLIYASGYFTTIGGIPRSRVAAINNDGTLNDWDIDISSSPAYATVNFGYNTFIAGNGYTIGDGTLGLVAIDRANGPAIQISLSNNSTPEDSPINTVVGVLSSDDDTGDTHSYALVSGQGDQDNGEFEVVGNELRIISELDYETDTYKNVRVRSTDNSGNVKERFFGVFITNVVESENDIVSFSFQEGSNLVRIDTVNHIVAIDAGDGVDRSSLTPDIELSSGASISPNTGIAQNFWGNVTYTVTAEDGTTQDWTIDAMGSISGGTYTVKSGGDFSTLRHFMDRVNNDGISGNVIVEITGNQDSNPSVAFVFREHLGEEQYSITLKADEAADPFELTDPLRLYGTNNFHVDGGDKMRIPGILLARSGSSTGSCENITISNSIIDTQMLVWWANDVTVDGNYFDGVTATTSYHARSIYLDNGETSNITVSNNIFSYDQTFDASSSQSSTIAVSANQDVSGYLRIFNNVVHLNPATASNQYGFNITYPADDLEIYNNTITIDGSNSTFGTYAVGIIVTNNGQPTNSLKIKNNLIQMSPTLKTVAFNYGIWYYDTGIPTTEIEANNISYLASGASNEGFMRFGATSFDDTNEATMFSTYGTTTSEPSFTDLANLDLSLTGSSLAEADFRGVPVPFATEDINAVTRSLTVPSKGAYEVENNITDIVSISFTGQSGDETIDKVNAVVDAEVPIGTDISSVSIDVTVFSGANVSPISGSTQDFSSGGVTYTVTAENADTRDWTININEENETPTDISLSSTDIDENEVATTLVGMLTTVDLNASQTHTYTLVSGTGDDDNASFYLEGDLLRSNEEFDFEVNDTYSIRLQTNDNAGGLYEESFNISINNVWEAPTDISITGFPNTDENNEIDDELFTLQTTDPDNGESFTYSLVAGTGDTDNASFSIAGDKVLADDFFNHEVQDVYSFRIQTDDGNGNQYSESFSISINDLNDDPTEIQISSSSIQEGNSINDVVGTLSTVDEDDADSHLYSLVSGTGSAGNTSFNINGNELRASAVFDYEANDSWVIRVRTDDQNGGIHEEVISISIANDPESPTDIMLSGNSIIENNSIGDVVGTISTDDPDSGETFTYSLVAGSGDDDNASFSIVGDELRAAEAFDFETKDSYTVRIETNDGNSGTYSESFSITISDEDPETIEWNGASWSNGSGPTTSDPVLFTGNYSGGFDGNDIEIANGVTVTITSGNTADILGDLDNQGSFEVESGASLLTYETGTVTGNDITIRRNTRYSDGKYSFVGTPIEQNASTLGSDLGGFVYKYEETVTWGTNDGLDRWVGASADELVPGKGYTQANQQLIEFSGTPNTGLINFTGTYTGTYNDGTNEDTEGWNLVANPYPAAISVSDFLLENTNNTGAIYLWDDNGSDEERGDNSDYVVANGIAATNTTPAGGESRYNLHIGAAQGFFVQLASDTDTDISFTESMRVAGNNGDAAYFRTESIPLTRVNLTSNSGIFRQAVIGWIDEEISTKPDRRFDAPLFDAHSSSTIYSIKDEVALAIQGAGKTTESISLGVNLPEDGVYSISIELEHYDAPVILWDQLKNIKTDLRNGAYEFSSKEGSYTDRFQILQSVITGSSLKYSGSQVYSFQKRIFIKNVEGLSIGFKVYSLNGNEVWAGEVDGNRELLLNIPEGLYIITDGENSWKVLLND